MSELLRLLVVEYHIVSYGYFLDHLQPYELPALLEAIPYADRAAWEQTRLKIFSTASMFSKKELTVKDIMQFPWDGNEQQQTQAPNEKELQRLKSTAEKLMHNANRL